MRQGLTFRIRQGLVALLLATFALVGGSAHAEGDEVAAKAVVANFYSVLEISVQNGETLGYEGRYKLIEPEFLKAYDMDKMARRVLGPDAQGITQDQFRKFRAAFIEYSVSVYASRFKGPNGPRFEIGAAKVADGVGILVESQIIPSDGDAVAISYLLVKTGDAWKINDVYLKGSISELATRRSDFSAILRKEGIEGLIESLAAKTAQSRAG